MSSTSGTLAVCDEDNNNVQIFTEMGREFWCVWGKAGPEPGHLLHPCAVAWVGDEQLAVVERGSNCRVQIFDANNVSVRLD